MKFSFKFTAIVAVLLTIVVGATFAAQSYRAYSGQTTEVSEHGVCKKITNAAGVDYFIPTNTTTEWQAFQNNYPTGITLAECQYLLANSLKLDGVDDYLSWTPGSSGSRQKVTVSQWVKRSSLGGSQTLFSAFENSSNFTYVGFDTSNRLYIRERNGSNAFLLVSNNVYRDPSDWIHIVISVDTTHATQSQRVRAWVDGEEVTSWNSASYPSGNLQIRWSNNVKHVVGYRDDSAPERLNGYMANVQFVDGQALAATSFGEFDSSTGKWVPKEYSGSYGTNGFYLDFADKSNLGKDVSGNGNDWDINGFSNGPSIVEGQVSTSSTRSEGNTSSSLYTDLPGDGRTYTLGFWLYLDKYTSSNGNSINLFSSRGVASNQDPWVRINASTGLSMRINYSGASARNYFGVSNMFELHEWTHVLLVVDTPNNSMKVYRNGELMTMDFLSVPTNDNTLIGSGQIDQLGAGLGNSGYNFQGHMADFVYKAGVAMPISDFFTNGQYATPDTSKLDVLLKFESGNLGVNSVAPGTYDWTVRSGMTDGEETLVNFVNPQTTDNPTNNYATWNPLDALSSSAFQNGNRTVYGNASAGNKTVTLTSAMPQSGKWEVQAMLDVYDVGYPMIGFSQPNINRSTTLQISGAYEVRDGGGSYKINPGTGVEYIPVNTPTAERSDVLKLCYNADTESLWVGIYKNGVTTWLANSSGSSGNPVSGTNPTMTGVPRDYFIATTVYRNDKITIATSDDDFWVAPESGFLSLKISNFPTPSIQKPSNHFEVITYTGNGGTQTVTGTDWGEVDQLVWMKDRDGAYNHRVYDTVRGSGYQIYTNATNAEEYQNVSWVNSFSNNGFGVTGTSGVNHNGNEHVAWRWKAGNSQVSNTAGTITSIVSANTAAGFSIVKYTGNSIAGATVGHGLGKVPQIIVTRNLDYSDHWRVYHEDLGPTDHLVLNSNINTRSNVVMWNNTSPINSVFTLGTDPSLNRSGDEHIAYVWSEVEGYSKFGSYIGNGNADGSFVYTGFKPRFIIVKKSSGTGSWVMYDIERDTANPNTAVLYANSSNAEGNASNMDIVSNGFKARGTSSDINSSGGTYIYMAFADEIL